MKCEKISQHGKISESSKTSKNQNYKVEIFSNNREQQKAKIQT